MYQINDFPKATNTFTAHKLAKICHIWKHVEISDITGVLKSLDFLTTSSPDMEGIRDLFHPEVSFNLIF